MRSVNEGAKIITSPARGITEAGLHNITTDARVDNLRRARGEHLENYDFTGELRIDASECYAKEAGRIADTQAAANIAAARTQRDLAEVEWNAATASRFKVLTQLTDSIWNRINSILREQLEPLN